MNTLNDNPPRFRRPVLLGFFVLLAAAATGGAQEIVRTKASTGIYTLQPRQTIRIHLVEIGPTTVPPVTARVELRDDRGTLLGFRTATLRPGSPIHLVLRSANLLGSRPFLYVRATATMQSEVDDLADRVPIFSVQIHPEAPGGLAIATDTQCPMRNMGDPPTPMKPVYNCGGGCDVVHDLIAPGLN